MGYKVLVVAVGGIGCEIMKNLILYLRALKKFLDLDIIELSNLNRQFLFQTIHIG